MGREQERTSGAKPRGVEDERRSAQRFRHKGSGRTIESHSANPQGTKKEKTTGFAPRGTGHERHSGHQRRGTPKERHSAPRDRERTPQWKPAQTALRHRIPLIWKKE